MSRRCRAAGRTRSDALGVHPIGRARKEGEPA